MVKWFFGFLAFAAVSLAVYLYFYLGVFKPVRIRIKNLPEIHRLYKQHLGAYHQILPTLQEVERWALSQNLPCPKTFGEFLDDPNAVEQDRLRSRVGCLLYGPPPMAIPSHFTYDKKAPGRYVVARFDGAPSIGPFKVYPKVQEFLEENRLISKEPPMEVYTVNGNHVITEFLFPLPNKD